MIHADHLILITERAAGERVLSAWYRVLPEDDLASVTARQGDWKEDVVHIFHSHPDYIEALAEIIDETIPERSARFVAMF